MPDRDPTIIVWVKWQFSALIQHAVCVWSNWPHSICSLFLKLTSKNTKIAENAENAKIPRDAILFPANFEILFLCFVRKFLDSWPMLWKQYLPFISYCTIQQFRDGLDSHLCTVQKISHRGTLIYLCVKGTPYQPTDKVLINNWDAPTHLPVLRGTRIQGRQQWASSTFWGWPPASGPTENTGGWGEAPSEMATI